MDVGGGCVPGTNFVCLGAPVVLGSGSTVSSVISCIGIAPAPSITDTKVNMTQAFILIAVGQLNLINKSSHFCNCYKLIPIEDDDM